MANYEAKFRSNYFEVNDAEAFQAFCERHNLELIEKENRFGFLMSNSTEGGFSNNGWDTEAEEDTDVLGELCQLLAQGQVAIILEVGNEKMRYLNAQAWVINSEGKSKHLDLTDLAMEAAATLTTAEVLGPEY